ncbi:MAG: ribonuclease HI family protein [Ignavibacteria bacterium]|nr:ribonuclease HI family protein [Ignavibacteria bacterium]
MTLFAYTDGASRGNPGDSGIGLLVKDEAGAVVLEENGYIGKATNNVAEYTALIALLKRIITTGCTRLVVHSDSELMVRQVNGLYKVKDPDLRVYFREVKDLLARASFDFELRHVPREMNREADRLANGGIDARTVIAT